MISQPGEGKGKLIMEFVGRRRKLAKSLRRKKFGCILIGKKENIFYLTGLDINEILLSVSDTGIATIFSGPLYKLELSLDATRDINYRIYENRKIPFFEFVSGHLKKEILGRKAIEDSFSFHSVLKFKKYFPHLKSIHHAIEDIREIKEAHEINLIKKAARIGHLALKHIRLKLKAKETEEGIAQKIEKFVLERWPSKASLGFKTLVTSGPRLAIPHGLPTSKRIKKSECVLVDLGVKIFGYNSDLTRMLSVGRISNNSKKIIRIVHDAQRFAIEKVRPGIKASVIDKAARDFISKKGYAKFFIHGVGHGIGLEVHERPVISAGSKESLKTGMIFTIEPGIYIPGGGGARVEDMLLVTEKGFLVL